MTLAEADAEHGEFEASHIREIADRIWKCVCFER